MRLPLPLCLTCTLLCAGPLLLAGCADIPDLDDNLTPAARSAPYPALVPIAPLLAGTEQAQQIKEGTAPALQGRVAALRARAARLRGGVVDGGTRRRMDSGVNTAPLDDAAQ